MQVKVETTDVKNKGSRRKLIQKVRRKAKRQTQRLAKAYEGIEMQPRSGLGSMITNNTADECDFDMMNHITMGQNRKMKKKLKKLQKVMGEDKQKIFKQMNKYKQSFYRVHQKKIFNSVNQLQRRRNNRMKKMESNAKRRKNEVLQKKLEQFE